MNYLRDQEDANKGDLIDLKSLHDLDIDKTTITAVVNSIRRKEFNDALQDALQKETEQIKRESDLRLEIKVKEVIAEKDQKITRLEDQIENSSQAQELAIIKAVDPIEKERDQIKIQKESIEISYKEEIERLKDMKTKLSTKMLGETLEQHCEIEFNKLRATAFQSAYFEKDNDINTGSKGDYVYRESDDAGNEIISIMFEMKNEGDETATKHRNEDFLAKLDADRKKKKRNARRLWSIKINAAARENGMSYSKLINHLKKLNIELDRKILADLAQNNPEVFKKIVEAVK